MRIQVKAIEVQVGDKVVDLSEVDYIVTATRRVTQTDSSSVPTSIHEQGGWVSIAGDSGDHFFERVYGGVEDYYAHPSELIIVERFN